MPTKHLWSGGLKGGVKACWSGCVRSREAEEAGVHEVSQEGFQKERRELRTNLREGREEVRGSEKVVGSNTEDCWSWVLVGLSCRDESDDERGDT